MSAMENVTPRPYYEIPDASERLDDLERVQNPSQYARGRLSGLLLARLADRDRERAEALRAKWGAAK